MPNKKRRCAFCKKSQYSETMHIHGVQAFCTKEHFIDYACANRDKLAKKGAAIVKKESIKRQRERKEELRPIKHHQDILQSLINQWIVHVRDKDKPCCTCGANSPDIKYDAGHFRSRGSCPELRFELLNIHKQCSVKCNVHGSGMRAEYRDFIIGVYGEATLEWIEGKHTQLKEKFPHWTDYKKEIARYRVIIREAGLKPCK